MAMSAALLALRKNAPFLLWSLKNAAGELGFPAAQVCFYLSTSYVWPSHQ
jgi:hypothetical protein